MGHTKGTIGVLVCVCVCVCVLEKENYETTVIKFNKRSKGRLHQTRSEQEFYFSLLSLPTMGKMSIGNYHRNPQAL